MSFVATYPDQGGATPSSGSPSARTRTCTIEGVRDGRLRDAVTGAEIHVDDGRLSFQVRANSAGIYVLDGPGQDR
jgi:hypothetical protein